MKLKDLLNVIDENKLICVIDKTDNNNFFVYIGYNTFFNNHNYLSYEVKYVNSFDKLNYYNEVDSVNVNHLMILITKD